MGRLMSDGDVDDSFLDDLDTEDPRTLGRMLREMSSEVGEDLGDEFEEVVGRLEKGENPEDIEASMPELLGDDMDGGMGGMGGMGGGMPDLPAGPEPSLGGLDDD